MSSKIKKSHEKKNKKAKRSKRSDDSPKKDEFYGESLYFTLFPWDRSLFEIWSYDIIK